MGRKGRVPVSDRAASGRDRPLRLGVPGRGHDERPERPHDAGAIEELFWGDAGIGMAIMGSGLAAAGIAASASPSSSWNGSRSVTATPQDLKLGAFCASEADAGSDVGGYRTSARYDEATDEWVLNGTKAWITNGGIANIHVVVAVVEPELPLQGSRQLCRAAWHEGPLHGSEVQEARHPSQPHRRGRARRCRVPGRCLLGGKDKLDERLERVRRGEKGNSQAAMQTFEATRPAVGAQAIGIARAAFEYSLEYAKEREAFGKPIIMNQAIAFMLADMATEIEATRGMIYRAAWLGKQKKFVNAEGSMAKMKAGRVATWVTERAIQILGGYGYSREYPVERWHRDAKIHDIFEGTEQIQQLVISRAISGLRIE